MKKLLVAVPLLILLCFTFSCQNQEAKAELEEMKAKAKLEAQNMEIIRELFMAIDKGNLDRINELIADDFVLQAPGIPEPLGRDLLIQVRNTFYASFPDNVHMIERIVAQGDRVAVRLTQHATHKAEYEGIPATGKRVTVAAAHVMKITDGKIKEWWAIEDNLGLMQQLGMELKPKEGEK